MKYTGVVNYLDSLEGGFLCLTAEDGMQYHVVDELGILVGLNSGDMVTVDAERIEGFGFTMTEGGMLKVNALMKH